VCLSGVIIFEFQGLALNYHWLLYAVNWNSSIPVILFN
jgi:hypothetical protein